MNPPPNLDCLGAETLAAYLDGLLAVDAIGRADRHIDHCRACRGELSALAETQTFAAGTGDSYVAIEGTPIENRLGRYEVLREIGHGSMGVVVRAYDPELARTIAVKILSPRLWDGSDAREMTSPPPFPARISPGCATRSHAGSSGAASLPRIFRSRCDKTAALATWGMNLRLASLALVTFAFPALTHADEIGADPNDPGRVTKVRKGVWEFDAGALGVMSVDNQGDSSITRISTDANLSIHHFLRDNVSVGVAGIINYDSSGGGNSAITYGGAGVATLHLRLGLGAFVRPTIALGALLGQREIPMDAGIVEEATQVAFIARIGLPIAYFTSKRFLLHAGPQLHVTAGSYTPMGGESQTFTRIAGGFGVGLGYVF